MLKVGLVNSQSQRKKGKRKSGSKLRNIGYFYKCKKQALYLLANLAI